MLTGDAARADDLVQETLARGWEKRRLWQAGTDLRAWLFTIMHNVFVNQRAGAAREAANVSLDAESEAGGGAWQVPVPAAQFARVELAEILQQVGRLPVEQRETLLLAAVEEMRYEEIAVDDVGAGRHRDVAAVAREGEAAPDDRRASRGAQACEMSGPTGRRACWRSPTTT